MNTLVIVGDTDITQYVDWKNYKMESKDTYESWKDGNYVEHRVYVRSKITGSFKVWLCGINGMDTDAFMALFNSATNNHVTTLGIYDQVSNSMKAINAYCEITPNKHGEMINGNYFDIFTIKVTER